MKNYLFSAIEPAGGFNPGDVEKMLLAFPVDVSPDQALDYVSTHKQAFPLQYRLSPTIGNPRASAVLVLIAQRTTSSGYRINPAAVHDDVSEDGEDMPAEAEDDDGADIVGGEHDKG